MNAFEGRWDLTVGGGDHCYPSWLEIQGDGGRFVGKVGSARPIPKVSVTGPSLRFSLPRQYEACSEDLEFDGRLVGDDLLGTTKLENGSPTVWKGVRAPELPRKEPNWGAAIELIGPDLSNWWPRSGEDASRWSIQDGQLVNEAVGSDIVTADTFADFKLIAEYRYPAKSNSGIYLRGRYEFQIWDDYESGGCGVGNSGAIYGFLAPATNAIRPPQEWNTAEITLLGRFVTVVLNGITIIDDQEIPGITGGALDSNEAEPGPIFLQGDHGPVTFRRLTLFS